MSDLGPVDLVGNGSDRVHVRRFRETTAWPALG